MKNDQNQFDPERGTDRTWVMWGRRAVLGSYKRGTNKRTSAMWSSEPTRHTPEACNEYEKDPNGKSIRPTEEGGWHGRAGSEDIGGKILASRKNLTKPISI